MGKQIKRRILFINSVCNGSTGKICKDLYDLASDNGFECCIAFGRGESPKGYKTYKIGNSKDVYKHVLLTRLLDKHGLGSKKSTERFIEMIDQFKPDIIHLHNIHGYYINIPVLFAYFEEHPNINVVWTLHDCWAFTGHCAYFTFSKCNKWKTGCRHCSSKNDYPKSVLLDSSERNYAWKETTFSNAKNLTLVTPSRWLKELVQESFLSEKKCLVINNGINTEIFCQNVHIERCGKKIVLGVANIWDNRKGLSFFQELYGMLNKDKYQIVLVGLSESQIKGLPDDIIKIKKTDSVQELVKIYNAADIFFNPTLEDNYPTVNLEAQACGTPVITFDSGGSPETLISTSTVVKDVQEAKNIIENSEKMKENFVVDLTKLEAKHVFKEYISLYKEIIGGTDESTCNRSQRICR